MSEDKDLNEEELEGQESEFDPEVEGEDLDDEDFSGDEDDFEDGE